MRLLSSAQVHARKVAELGLDSTALDLASTEALGAALRRAAGFLCPCSGKTLVRSVVNPLRSLVDDIDAVRVLVEETLEAVVAYGDILELRDVASDQPQRASHMLYAAPASFVLRRTGAALLIGVTSDSVSGLPRDFAARIEYANHSRRLTPLPGEDLRSELVDLGLLELSHDVWMKSPPAMSPSAHIEQVALLLDAAPPSYDIPGLSLLDPERPVRYYRGRWVEPRSQTGRFVARRAQAYGSDLWCYVQLHNGQPERLIDLPLPGSRWRGCDEAWLLQLAIDAKRGEPQRLRIRRGPHGMTVFELFSPLPAWAKRRWDSVGESTSTQGCLFAYRFASAEAEEELRFIRVALWLDELHGDTMAGKEA